MVGFGHNTVLSIADQVIAGVKSGAIRHFFLVAGCDAIKNWGKLVRFHDYWMSASVMTPIQR